MASSTPNVWTTFASGEGVGEIGPAEDCFGPQDLREFGSCPKKSKKENMWGQDWKRNFMSK